MATITPPQSLDSPVRATCGAHCLVIDVSYSMEASATVKSTAGDDIDHGFSLLDIAKHASSTFVSVLGDADLITIVTYSSAVKVEAVNALDSLGRDLVWRARRLIWCTACRSGDMVLVSVFIFICAKEAAES